jgi:sugar transferase EpsL
MDSRILYRILKRLLDIGVSAAVLILASPLIAAVAVLVRLRMGSPVIFRHRRPGYLERPFDCLKFRSMTSERDSQGELLPDDQRLTAFGKFLRRTSLDELPQLWSVLKGDMSLVGPRPLEMRYLKRYSPEQRRRHFVKPGITGWAQVNGRNAIDWDRKFQLDLWYVEHSSFSLDLRILTMTFFKVVSGDGVSQAGHATMSEFYGSASPEATPRRTA